MPGLLTIGDFSRMTHLSIRTLRRYHEGGLLDPAEVDAVTGYRYYDPAQIATAQAVRRFRELGMPVREIRDLLGADDDRRGELLAKHLGRLEEQLRQTQHAVSSLRRLLAVEVEPEVRRRTVPEQLVAAVRTTVRRDAVLTWYAEAMQELDAVLARHTLTPTGPPGGLYANDLFTDDVGELVAYVPVAGPPTEGRVESLVIPAPTSQRPCTGGTTTTSTSPTAGSAAGWPGQGWASPARCTSATWWARATPPDEERWRTEIGWPVVTDG